MFFEEKKIMRRFFAILITIVITTGILSAALPANAKLKVYRCQYCSGTGSVQCNICYGSGRGYYYDVYEHSYIYMACLKCNGAGRVRCGYCGGAGSESIDVPEPKETSLIKLTAKAMGFTAQWKKQTFDTAGYDLQYATDKNFKKNEGTIEVNGKNSNTSAVKNLKANTKYYVRIRTYCYYSVGRFTSSWSKAKTVVTKSIAKPTATSLKKLSAKVGGFSVSWKKQTKNVSGYQIQYSTDSKFKNDVVSKNVKGNGKTSLNISLSKDGAKYFVRIRTYKSADGSSRYSAWSKVKSVSIKSILPVATEINEIEERPTGFFVEWQQQTKNVTGYQIQYATDSNFTNAGIKTVKGNQTVSNEVFGLQEKTEYSVRIRTYREYNGKNYYSAWSKALTVKTWSMIPEETWFTAYSVKYGTLMFKFKYIEECSGYEFQVSKNPDFSDAKTYCFNNGESESEDWSWNNPYSSGAYVKSPEIRNYSTSYFEKNVRYYFRVRTYNILGDETYYSEYSKWYDGMVVNT